MIYIDPPYNTGSDGFVYEDDRKFTVQELAELAGIDEEKAKRILDFTRSKSNSHSAWLTFMYPRLYIAKQLLRDDGVIFVSIDDNEVAQLRILMDEIFGEENFVGIIPRITSFQRSGQEKYMNVSHDYVIVYSYSDDLNKIATREIDESKIKKDHIGHYLEGDTKALVAAISQGYSKGGDYDFEFEGKIFKPITKEGVRNRWLWDKERMEAAKKLCILRVVGNSLRMQIYLDKRFDEKTNTMVDKDPNLIFHTADFMKEKGYDNPTGTAEISKLFGNKKVFNNPKPIKLIKDLTKLATCEDSIILDFFAGSGTTGDAVMQLNAEDGGNRKYILVQLPEPIDEKKNKTAYDFVKNELGVKNPTIFEITKERLIRAAKKIKEETINKKIAEKKAEIEKLSSQLDLEEKDEKIKQLKQEIQALESQDLGFKIFETMPIWEGYDFKEKEFSIKQKLFDENQINDDDLQVLLTTWKTYDEMALTDSLEKIDLDGYTGYYGNGKLYLVNKGFKTKHLKALLNKIDRDKSFSPASIIVFGYNFESKALREIAENIANYTNKKKLDIDFITRY
jgi:adenine-specific DNA-methyltransferase